MGTEKLSPGFSPEFSLSLNALCLGRKELSTKTRRPQLFLLEWEGARDPGCLEAPGTGWGKGGG